MGRGTQRELAVKHWLRDDGWWTVRCSNSLGDADVLALKAGETPRMIEVKSNKTGGPWMNFRKADRDEMVAAATMAGARAELCYWPPRAQPRFIPSEEWP